MTPAGRIASLGATRDFQVLDPLGHPGHGGLPCRAVERADSRWSGLSRDDATKFLELYQARKLIEGDPFASLDTVGVGALIKMGIERGRAAKPDLKVGIRGEHGGDPSFGVVTLW